tara:strand:- start:359 stop:1633 length:1275 start_codon:yes stop_codon:yes gene_type:complete
MNNFKIFKFDNGFKYLTIKNKSIQHCIILILLGTGSVFEKKELSGISHYLEHMPFKGTKTYKNTSDLSYKFDSLGSEINAFTDREVTGYYIKINKKFSTEGLKILKDLVTKPLLRQADIEQERNVILEEYRKGLDEPTHILDELLHDTLFIGHQLSNSVIGTPKSIKHIKTKDIRKYHKKHYVLSNMSLAIIGNYPNQIHDDIKKYFNHKDKPYTYKQLDFTYNYKGSNVIYKEKLDQERTCISISFPTTHFNNSDKYVLELIGTCLGGGMSSRLFTELREKNSLVYNVSSDQITFYKGGYFEISTCVNEKNIDKAIDIILKEIDKLKTHKMNKKELVKCYNLIKGNTEISSEDLNDIAEFYTYQLIYANKVINYNTLFKKMKKITPDDIMNVANKYFNFKNIIILIYGKAKAKTLKRIKHMIK